MTITDETRLIDVNTPEEKGVERGRAGGVRL